MKKCILTIALMFMTLGIVWAGTANGEFGYITVSSDIEENVTPDVVKTTFTIETSNKIAKIASDKNKEITTKVLNAIKPKIDETKGETLKTSGFSVRSQYSYNNGKQNFEKYVVTNTFEIKVKDIAKIGEIIDIGVQNGATNVSGFNYSLEDDENICNELIAKSAKSAKIRADYIARAMNTKITGVKQANTSCSIGTNYARYNYAALKSSMDAATEGSSIPVESGKIKIRANFEGQFYISQ